jgi:hypothetical protein
MYSYRQGIYRCRLCHHLCSRDVGAVKPPRMQEQPPHGGANRSAFVIPRPHGEVERVLPKGGKVGYSPDEKALRGGGGRQLVRARRRLACGLASGK